MKKFWNIFVLLIFINSLALPSIASVFDLDVPQTNVIISEEETHTSSFFIFEKSIPKVLNVMDYLILDKTNRNNSKVFISDDTLRISPLLGIYSPPPEV